MTATTSSLDVRTTPVSPAARWSSTGRAAAALTLVTGGALWTAGELIGWGQHGDAQLGWMRAHPLAAQAAISAELLGTLVMFGAAATWFTLARARFPRLARAGAGLLVVGLALQEAMTGLEMTQYALTRNGGIPLDRLASALSSPADMGLPGYLFVPLFYLGAFAGVVIAMVALWRARAVSRPAIVLVVAFQLLSFVDVLPWTPVLLVGLCWMAVDVLRAGRRDAVVA